MVEKTTLIQMGIFDFNFEIEDGFTVHRSPIYGWGLRCLVETKQGIIKPVLDYHFERENGRF